MVPRLTIRGYLLELLGSVNLTLFLLLGGALVLAAATLVESYAGAEIAQALVYHSVWFELYLLLVVVNLVLAVVHRIPIRRHQWAVVLTHVAVILLLAGSWISRSWGYEGQVVVREGSSSETLLLAHSELVLVQLGTPRPTEFRYPVPTALFPAFQVLREESELLPAIEMLELVRDAQLPLAPHGAPQMPSPRAGPSLRLRLRLDGECSEFWVSRGSPRRIECAGRPFELRLDRAHDRLPFSIEVQDYRVLSYPGTRRHTGYESSVVVRDRSGATPALATVIGMDQPLDYMGFRIFQTAETLAPPSATSPTRFRVVHDPGVQVVYVAFVLLILGIGWYVFGGGRRRREHPAEASAHDPDPSLSEIQLQPRAPKSRRRPAPPLEPATPRSRSES